MKHSVKFLGALSVLAVSIFSFSGPAAAAPLPVGWTCTANCGTLGADGVVTASPEGGTYGYVSTSGGVAESGIGLGSETNGSLARTSLFSANPGDDLEFYFNYVTSDGGAFTEYAWVRLLDSDLNEVALLFTARTNPVAGGDTVPGFGMPALAPGVVLVPPSTPIIAGGPAWSPLGGSSGDCYSTGCGYTDWIAMTYEIAAAGNYYLEFGVVNWLDTAFDSGLAFDGILVAGQSIDNGTIPEPASLALLGLALAGLAAVRRRKMAA
ncbi:MAG: hypothetical protein A3E79_16755 [Burkholderiales bacterium RIFCSPHIGHO2_12_FULL_61_11]|nr:MAG: hypothetical protein A3E79_16755 [Burkholderiales bacterium RIFCSPHIGHO2_12_FULL_61_11]